MSSAVPKRPSPLGMFSNCIPSRYAGNADLRLDRRTCSQGSGRKGSDHLNLARKVIVPPWAVKLCHFTVQYEGLSQGQSIPIRMAGPPGGVPATGRTHSQVAFRLDDVAMTICPACR